MRHSILASLGLVALTACRSSAPAEPEPAPVPAPPTVKPEIRYYEIADT